MANNHITATSFDKSRLAINFMLVEARYRISIVMNIEARHNLLTGSVRNVGFLTDLLTITFNEDYKSLPEDETTTYMLIDFITI